MHGPSVPVEITMAKDEIFTLWNLQPDRWQRDGRKEYTECLIDLPASPWMAGNKNLLKIRKKMSLILIPLKGSADVAYE